MKIEDYLPIGSIVKIENNIKLMITGIKIKNFKSNKSYDYIAVLYPEGFMGFQNFLFINHNSIKEVLFRGFEDEDRKKFITNIKDKDKSKDNKNE